MATTNALFYCYSCYLISLFLKTIFSTYSLLVNKNAIVFCIVILILIIQTCFSSLVKYKYFCILLVFFFFMWILSANSDSGLLI